ncbi:MAG: carbohydrate ABC transporter permease, partial [Acholeplasmataceae bacterium]
MKTNVIEQLKASYHGVVENIKDPKKNAKRSRKAKEISFTIVRSTLLIGLCFVILFPTIQQILMALRAPSDVNNPAVIWIPEQWSIMNIKIAAIVLDYQKAVVNSFKLSAISMVLQMASTALAGYAFSRLRFKGSNILFILVILTIVIPPQALSLSQYLYFRGLGLIGKEGSIYLMSGLGMGIRSGIFIYIFRSFFRGLPKELEESAMIDGAGVFRTFWSVMLPNARGALVTVGL